jgi:hypothetical protein
MNQTPTIIARYRYLVLFRFFVVTVSVLLMLLCLASWAGQKEQD